MFTIPEHYSVGSAVTESESVFSFFFIDIVLLLLRDPRTELCFFSGEK